MVDAKDPSGNTEYEDWWSKVVRPFLQTISIRDPFPELEDGDYSHFVGKPMAVPEHVVKQFPDARGDQAFSMNSAFGIEFSPTTSPGLEIVDVLTIDFEFTPTPQRNVMRLDGAGLSPRFADQV